MKKEFVGFYKATKKEIDQAWEKGYFVFDTNALLNLYRYTADTRNDFLAVLKNLKDRLYLPHQIALEFHSNRLNVIKLLNKSYSIIKERIESNFEKDIKPELQAFKRHPSILVENIIALYSEFITNMSKELATQRE